MTIVSFMSWNLALMARSAQAPQHWEMYNTEAHVREAILAADPDVVLLQELPGLVPFVETHEMVGPNPQTHSGNLAILVKRGLVQPDPSGSNPAWSTVGNFANSVTIGDVTVANVHLESGAGAADRRLEQIKQVVQKLGPERLIVVGDTNTRVAEEQDIALLGLVGPRPPRPTWNSKKNRFNSSGAEFSAYFSRWFLSSDLALAEPWVGDTGHVEVANKRFFVSDHFACGAIVSS